MKLLFDQNLSHRLVSALEDLFPGSAHVRFLGLARADDTLVWEHARDSGHTLVSKDADFRQLSFLHGAPPKVIWVKRGNCSTAQVINLLRKRHEDICKFGSMPDPSFLTLA